MPVGLDAALDFDLRLVRYFTVVAEHLNFAKAAEALHVAQPALSRQIMRLEQQLGVRLLDRTPQGSRLTEAGRVFLPQALGLLRSARQAAHAATASANSLTVGSVEQIVVTPAVRDLRRRRPDARVDVRHLNWCDAHPALLDGSVDVLVGRTPFPFPLDDLDVTELYEEPSVLVVPLFHRLAARTSVTPDDYADEPMLPCPVTSMASNTFWRLEPGRASADPPATIDGWETKLERVADGEAVAIRPAGDRRSTLRPDLATIPIEGLAPFRVVVATRRNATAPLLDDFRESAQLLREQAPGQEFVGA
ncbi:LysR family transcriptional regulator [Cryptosporangium phraense]|uniref:LysR family transcriptional regulator n=1 Tax=Cryptosporangium phraense TaxID=2593070 RepID=UPI00197A9283|nr:LysR family transcriptional regulator [Cryptosporangium phraense]